MVSPVGEGEREGPVGVRREGQPARLVVRCDDQERVRVRVSIGERHLHGVVEGEDLARRIGVVAGGGGGVDPPALDHQEEAVRVGGEDRECLIGHRGEARLRGHGRAHVRHRVRGKEPEGLRAGRSRDRAEGGRGGREGVPLRLGLGHEVAPVGAEPGAAKGIGRARGNEVLVSAAEGDLEVGVDELARDQELVGPAGDVRVGAGRRRVGDARVGERAGGPSARIGQFRDGREAGTARAHADHAVVGPGPGHERCRGRGRVRNRRIGRRRRYVAHVVEPVHRESRGEILCRVVACLLPARGLDMVAAHAVADHQDHVLRLPVACGERRPGLRGGRGDGRAEYDQQHERQEEPHEGPVCIRIVHEDQLGDQGP